ncbi:MAG: hypothetical protein HC898_02220 [Phycisphaerales bacterium]|nr:hypothetical protein [Phycisphaerales bacterium]
MTGDAREVVSVFAEKLRCSYTTAKREVDALKADDRIEFVGPTKTGHYTLAKS